MDDNELTERVEQNAPEEILSTAEDGSWRNVSYIRADLHEQRIAELETALKTGYPWPADIGPTYDDLEQHIAALEPEAALAGMWEQRATELEAAHGIAQNAGEGCLAVAKTYGHLLARAMPLLKRSRDGDALYLELERMGIEPVEADAVQCRVVNDATI
jgi:hypothetical protein